MITQLQIVGLRHDHLNVIKDFIPKNEFALYLAINEIKMGCKTLTSIHYNEKSLTFSFSETYQVYGINPDTDILVNITQEIIDIVYDDLNISLNPR